MIATSIGRFDNGKGVNARSEIIIIKNGCLCDFQRRQNIENRKNALDL